MLEPIKSQSHIQVYPIFRISSRNSILYAKKLLPAIRSCNIFFSEIIYKSVSVTFFTVRMNSMAAH